MADHAGLPVAGYKQQSEENVQKVNHFKEVEERLLREIDEMFTANKVKASGENGLIPSPPPVYDPRWLAIARTNLEQGFMALNRSVFQPGRVKLPEDTE